jgi:hypothetical protein
MAAPASLLSALLLTVAQVSPPATPRLPRASAPASPAAASVPAPATEGPPKEPVILFLVDNSASLPPLDPEEKRVAALEKIFTFLKGRPYRLILFGARREIFVDDVSKYRNNGQWTDFYFAFDKAREVAATYPPGTEFRIVLLTDGILDPDVEEWKTMDVPPGADLKAHVVERLLKLVGEMKIPLYVILVGDPPKEGVAPGAREQSPGLILDLVRVANGARAAPLAQTLASFFSDDGMLLRKFVFRVAPEDGLKKIVPLVQRVTAPPRAAVELKFVFYLVLPLLLFLILLLGLLVRSFPGPGDVAVVELSLHAPVHVAADRGTNQGLSLVADLRDASATFTYQPPALDLAGAGLDTVGAEPATLALLPLGVDELRRMLERHAEEGTKEEKIYALNLDYMAKNLDPAEAERLLTTPIVERRRISAVDFLRAKAHLATSEGLRRKLTEPRVQVATYGKGGERKELVPAATLTVGRYGFLVRDVTRGGRKDARLALYYDRVPSLLGLKTVLPDAFQRIFRLRRSSQRLVS